MYEWLKFGHVLGAILWVGAGITLSLLLLRISGADRATKVAVLHSVDKAAVVFPIAALFTLGFGVWMVIDSPTVAFGDTWVIIAYFGIALSGAVQAVVGPRFKLLRTQLEEGDPAADATWRFVARVNPLDASILVVVVWAMVSKPGL